MGTNLISGPAVDCAFNRCASTKNSLFNHIIKQIQLTRNTRSFWPSVVTSTMLFYVNDSSLPPSVHSVQDTAPKNFQNWSSPSYANHTTHSLVSAQSKNFQNISEPSITPGINYIVSLSSIIKPSGGCTPRQQFISPSTAQRHIPSTLSKTADDFVLSAKVMVDVTNTTIGQETSRDLQRTFLKSIFF